MYYVGNIPYDPNYIEHFGILGMKWGVRRWQYKDGRFNEAGKLRYFGSHTRENTNKKETVTLDHNRIGGPHATKEIQQRLKKAESKVINAKRHKMTPEEKRALAKKIAIGAGIVAATGLVAYGVYSTRSKSASSIIELGENAVTKMDKHGLLFNTALMSDKETILEKGAELHRMHGRADFDLNKVTSPLYTAFEKDDVDTYKVLLRDWAGTKERYDVTLKALNTIKSPGKRTRVETFIDLWNNGNEYREALAAEIAKFEKKSVGVVMGELEYMSKHDPEQLYKLGIWSLVKPGKAADMYIDAIKQKGYNAIVDDHDRLDKLAKTPIILLNASNDAVKTGQHLVQEDEYVDAFMNLLKIDHPQVAGLTWQRKVGLVTDEGIRDYAKEMYKDTFKK